MSNDRIIFPEFRDQQDGSRYPFSDSSSLLSSTGKVRIENDIFLDASIYPIGNTLRLHISQIEISPRLVVLYVSDNSRRTLATASFDPLATDVFTIRFVDSRGRDAGILVSEPDRLRVFAAWPVGTHIFPIGNADFVASCCIPTPEIGVRGILTADGDLLTGDIFMIGDNGIVITDDEGAIRIDASGDPLYLRKACRPLGKFNTPRYLQTINNCGPDAYGNFNLTVGDHLADTTILRIYPDGHGGLRLEAVGRLARE